MAWTTIPIKTDYKKVPPLLTVKNNTLTLNVGAWRLLAGAKEKELYIFFQYNDHTKAHYITTSKEKIAEVIKIPASSKSVKADLLQAYLKKKYGGVEKFRIQEEDPIDLKKGRVAFMIHPLLKN